MALARIEIDVRLDWWVRPYLAALGAAGRAAAWCGLHWRPDADRALMRALRGVRFRSSRPRRSRVLLGP